MKHVPDIAAAELAKLRQSGIQPSDDDVVWLASLGDKVENPSRGNVSNHSDGVTAGNVTLYPLTIQAGIWVMRFGEYFTDAKGLCAIAFAMAKGREEGAFADLHTLRQSVDAVTGWMETCTADLEMLMSAVERVQSNDTPADTTDDGENHAPPGYDRIINNVVAATGIPYDHWLTRSLEEVSEVLLLKKAITDDDFDLDQHESRIALRDLIRAVATIRAAHVDG